MRTTGSKSSTPSGDDKPADSSAISPAIAVNPETGEMRDVEPISPAPPAAKPATAPPVEFSHTTGAYGAVIETTLDHTAARVTHVLGDVVEFVSRLRGDDGNPEEPSAFAKAIAEAKDRWRVAFLQEQESKKQQRQAAIDAATAANKGAK